MATKLPKIINQGEFEKLFKYTNELEKKSTSKKKKRIRQYKLAMLLGFEAGMRISEIVGLTQKGKVIVPKLTQDRVDVSSIRIVSGKGKKDRIVPRPKRLNNTAVTLLPLDVDRRSIQRYITEIGEKVLKKKITFHTLRHGFCSHLAENDYPLHQIQMLAGHSRLDTTGIYLHANPKKAIEKAREVF